QTDQWQAKLQRHLLADDLLAADRCVCGTAAHREIVAPHHHRPALDKATPDDEIRRHEAVEGAGRAILRLSGDRAHLVKAAGIEKPGNPLAYSQLAAVMLAFDLLGSAHLPRQRLPPAQLLDVAFPAHRSFFLWRDRMLAASGALGHGCEADAPVIQAADNARKVWDDRDAPDVYNPCPVRARCAMLMF